MHSTIHHSPTAYQQIKRILILLACAIGCGVATIGLMLYTAQTERRYVLADVLIAPELLPRIALHENPHVWRFDTMEFAFVDPTTQQLTTRTLTPNTYAHLYAELALDASLNKTQHERPIQPLKSMELTIWLKTDRFPHERRILQTILFLPQTQTYRVLLYQLDHSSEHVWATFHHERLSTLLHSLMQEAL